MHHVEKGTLLTRIFKKNDCKLLTHHVLQVNSSCLSEGMVILTFCSLGVSFFAFFLGRILMIE